MRAGNHKINKHKAFKNALILIGISIFFYFFKTFALANLLLAAGVIILLNIYILHPASLVFQSKVIPTLDRKYKSMRSMALTGSKPIVLFFGTIALLVLSFVLIGIFTPKVEFFPINEPKYVNIFIEKPIGTDIESTNKLTKLIEQDVINLLTKYIDTSSYNGKSIEDNYLVESIIAQVGEGTSDPSRGPIMGNTPHKGRVQVSFVDFQNRRGVSTKNVLEEIREAVRHKYPGAQVTADKDEAGPPRGKPIKIEITGKRP